MFADDFKIFENRDTSAGVCTFTLVNIHHGLRSCRNSPATIPMMMWDSNAKNEHGYDAFIDEITLPMWRLAKGVMMWSDHYQRCVWVMLLLHVLTGDGPGRSTFGKKLLPIFTESETTVTNIAN
jgi:hypothetical protein